jgi:glutaminase
MSIHIAPTHGEPSAESPVLQTLQQLHRDCATIADGTVASYIPELSRADPNWFGICLATTGGSVYEVGDSRQPFTIQSISKPFVYGMALEDHGRSSVLKKIGVEPTGDVFNSISLEPGTGRPRNPMINAGAIAASGLVEGRQDLRVKRILSTFGKYAGRDLALDETVWRSESETGHRNRAIGHMLRNFEILNSDPIPVVELYFQQCSISVTCRDLAIMAATLANQGVNPVTNERALRGEYAESVLSVMETCGMYDFAGEWMYKVGMPAKSGVAGGIIAVLPGQLGIGVFSPPLDDHGNSVRGIRVCEELSRRFDLHQLNRPGMGRSTIRLRFTGADYSSRRIRTADQARILREQGQRIGIWQLQGDLAFTTAEVLMKDILAASTEFGKAQWIVVDFKRLQSINETACTLLYQLLQNLRASNRHLVFAATERVPQLRRIMRLKLGGRFESDYRNFDDIERALEWCEDQLIAAVGGVSVDAPVSQPTFSLFDGLDEQELSIVKSRMTQCRFEAGDTIIQVGDEAEELYLLMQGSVSVLAAQASGGFRRLASFQPGLVFGEVAVIDGARRSALVVADTTVECQRLTKVEFEALDRTHPAIKLKLWRNLCIDVCARLRKLTRELSVFD